MQSYCKPYCRYQCRWLSPVASDVQLLGLGYVLQWRDPNETNHILLMRTGKTIKLIKIAVINAEWKF